jgi:DNA-directed RNA polymerase subunit RPC12/RpoP
MVTCPVCRSRAIRRSVRRNIVERLRSLTGQYPYRCYDCQTRFFAFRTPHEASGNEAVEAQREEADREEAD